MTHIDEYATANGVRLDWMQEEDRNVANDMIEKIYNFKIPDKIPQNSPIMSTVERYWFRKIFALDDLQREKLKKLAAVKFFEELDHVGRSVDIFRYFFPPSKWPGWLDQIDSMDEPVDEQGGMEEPSDADEDCDDNVIPKMQTPVLPRRRARVTTANIASKSTISDDVQDVTTSTLQPRRSTRSKTLTYSNLAVFDRS